jgi:hypothetical protein
MGCNSKANKISKILLTRMFQPVTLWFIAIAWPFLPSVSRPRANPAFIASRRVLTPVLQVFDEQNG